MKKKLVAAKVTKVFPGVPDGEEQVRDIQVGEVITGELAKVAIAQNWADEVEAEEAAGAEAVDLDGMTVAQLKDFAAEHEIDLGDNTRKADIVAAIEKAQAKTS